MNLDIGSGFLSCHKQIKGALHADIQPSPYVDIICDIQHLPFRNKTFQNVFAYHVLEHVENPTLALKECLRVCCEKLEVEVPHRFSCNAKQDSKNVFDRHLWSFKASWFHRTLKQFRYNLRIYHYFPRYLYIHIWVYV